MARQPLRLVALRQTPPHDQLRRELVIIDAPPVAVIDGAPVASGRRLSGGPRLRLVAAVARMSVAG